MKNEPTKPETQLSDSQALPPSLLPLDQDVLWALSLVEEESELLAEEMAQSATIKPQPPQDFPETFPDKVMRALQKNPLACALGAKTPEPVLNLLYWGLNRPLAPVLGTAGAVLMCPVCVYSSGLIVIGMLWWGAKTPRPSSDSASQAS
jgi:hypothetical protein